MSSIDLISLKIQILGGKVSQSLHHVEIKLKQQFLIMSGYYIVPSPSTTINGQIEIRILLQKLFQPIVSGTWQKSHE